jgi:hypothetical protein
VVWVCERTIPTEPPPLVGEVSANFWRQWVQRYQRDRYLRPYSRFSRPEPLHFFQVAPQLYSRGWVDPVPDPLIFRKSGSAGNRTRTSGSVARNCDHKTTEMVVLSTWARKYDQSIILSLIAKYWKQAIRRIIYGNKSKFCIEYWR